MSEAPQARNKMNRPEGEAFHFKGQPCSELCGPNAQGRFVRNIFRKCRTRLCRETAAVSPAPQESASSLQKPPGTSCAPRSDTHRTPPPGASEAQPSKDTRLPDEPSEDRPDLQLLQVKKSVIRLHTRDPGRGYRCMCGAVDCLFSDL